MRKIKFRAWDDKENVMSFDESMGDVLCEKEYDKPHLILMQYTGQKDKKGKEIYEGDILREFNAEVNLFIVYFAEDIGQWKLECINEDYFCSFDGADYPNGVDSNRFEIIGNIYENPELLEEQE